MITTEYHFSEIAEDMHALAAEGEEQALVAHEALKQAAIAQNAIDYNKGWNAAYCSSPVYIQNASASFGEGYRDGRYVWKRDCSR